MKILAALITALIVIGVCGLFYLLITTKSFALTVLVVIVMVSLLALVCCIYIAVGELLDDWLYIYNRKKWNEIHGIKE